MFEYIVGLKSYQIVHQALTRLFWQVLNEVNSLPPE
jgi:hypothetical protein